MKDIIKLQTKCGIVEEAGDWLARFDRDETLQDMEREALREWLGRSPAHRMELEKLAALWDNMNILTELAVPGSKPKPLARFAPPINVPASRTRAFKVAVAATVIISIFTSFLLWMNTGSLLETNGFYATAVGQQKTMTLGDGSTITLNTNSQIKVEYSDSYRDIRLLQGEAHFAVASKADMPFRVFAKRGRIEAIGTAFAVYVKGSDVDVSVTEGRVKLASLDLPVPVTTREPPPPFKVKNIELGNESFLGELNAGQVATITEVKNRSEKPIIALENLDTINTKEINRRLSWREGFLVFSGNSLEDVVRQISRYTTVKIEIAGADLRAIRIGGRFPVGETETMFAALEESFGLTITRLDRDHVLISANDGY